MTATPQQTREEKELLVTAEGSVMNGRLAEMIEEPDSAGADEGQAGNERMVIRLRRLWNRRRTVIRLAGAGFVLSALLAFAIPRQYESTARLMPPDQSNSSSGLAMLAAASGSAAGSSLGSLAGGILGLKSSGALFIGILQSRTVQDDIVNRFHLQKIYGDRYEEDARKDLASNSSVFEDRKSGIITIQVTDSDPRRATGIAEEYTEELNRVVTQMSTSSAHREREFLEERLKSVQADLETAEKEFSQFSSKNGAIDIQAQGKAMIEGAAVLQGQLTAAESELQGLKQIYTDDNVRVRSLLAQIGELKSQLNRIGGKNEDANPSTDGMKNDPDYPSIRELPLLGVTYADLFRRTKVQEAVFETLTREYELAKVQEAKETPSVKVLDPPSVPEKKSFPPRLLIIFAGTLLALFGGIVWLAMTMFWDEIDPEDPRRRLALEAYHGAMAKTSLQSLNGLLLGVSQGRSWSGSSNRQQTPQEHE